MSRIDWSQASDEQLSEALAEQKRRQPLTDFENTKWGKLSDSEFAENKSAVFRAVRQHASEQRLRAEHLELEDEAQRRAQR
jgi:hypothetical protein